MLLLVTFAGLLFSVAAKNASAPAREKNQFLVYLTLSAKADRVNVNVVTANSHGNYTLRHEKDPSVSLNFSHALSNDKEPLAYDKNDLGDYTAAIDPTPRPGKQQYSYSLDGLKGGLSRTVKQIASNDASTDLIVCIFGDYRADLYTGIAGMNLSALIERNNCSLNLFIGKIAWEQRPQGFSFNPYLMLHDNNKERRHVAFASVPSIFGGVGHDLSETSFFQCVEVNGVAFIQTTVTLVTLANLTYGTEHFDKVEEYFRETMLSELECKLQELHRREHIPWIIVYLTHPSLFKDRQVNWLMLNSVDRFFEILKRYKIDLLTSCGIEGMAQLLKARAQSHPDEQLPTYLQTTLAECGGYLAFAPNLQNECSYAVLHIHNETIDYTKQSLEQGQLDSGHIEKNKEQLYLVLAKAGQMRGNRTDLMELLLSLSDKPSKN